MTVLEIHIENCSKILTIWLLEDSLLQGTDAPKRTLCESPYIPLAPSRGATSSTTSYKTTPGRNLQHSSRCYTRCFETRTASASWLCRPTALQTTPSWPDLRSPPVSSAWSLSKAPTRKSTLCLKTITANWRYKSFQPSTVSSRPLLTQRIGSLNLSERGFVSRNFTFRQTCPRLRAVARLTLWRTPLPCALEVPLLPVYWTFKRI